MRHGQLFFLTVPQAHFKTRGEIRRWLDGRKISEEQQRAANFRVVLRTALAFSDMSLHANQLDTGKRIVYEG